METKILGKDLKVSAIGLGCMGLSHANGTPIEENEAVRLLREAVEDGYTFFDTAETYGFNADHHNNEKLLGKAFAGMRNNLVIATKFGVWFDYSENEYHPKLNADSLPGDYPQVRGRESETSEHRLYRPVLSAPSRPQRGARGCGRGHGGAHQGGQNSPLGSVHGQCGLHPPGPRRRPPDCLLERVFSDQP